MQNILIWVLTAFFAAKNTVKSTSKSFKTGNGDTSKWLIILLGLVIFYLAWKEYQKSQSQNESKDIGSPNNLPATFAAKISAAMNLPTYEWQDAITNTDEASLYAIALEMRSSGVTLAEVYTSYNRLYTRDLQYDLSKRALDNKEYTKFLAILAGTMTPDSSVITTPTVPSTPKAPATPKTPTVPTKPTPTPTPSNVIGKRIKCLKNVNLRKPESPYAVDRVITAGTTLLNYWIESEVTYQIGSTKYKGYLLSDRGIIWKTKYVISSDKTLVQVVA